MMTENMARKMWYAQSMVKFEIVKALRQKELQIIGGGISVRWLNAQYVGILDSIFKHLKVNERVNSFYMSLDYYKKIPMMSFHLGKRGQQYKDWAKERPSQVIGADFGIDIDYKNGDWRDAIPDNELLRNLFDSYGVKYANWMSGGHGFHFIIPYSDMPDEIKALEYSQLIAFYERVAGLLSIKAKGIDMGIYMPTRVLKCPYTVEKNGRVILPLDGDDWEALKQGTLPLDPLGVLHRYGSKIYNRGIYLQGNKEGFKKFINEWDGWEK